ncbi:hypothetical protein os1_40350 [Comamonadaceae bacterium OS-1]|nr:hypothetical protein os1_40350 [Comamonadaceae bacterium OS-1]
MVDPNRHRRAVLEDVEPRILYAADHPVAAVAAPLLEQAAATVARAETQPEAVAPRDARELVFIDERVPDADLLIADITAQAAAGRQIEVLRIGADDDGIAWVSATLAERSDVTAVHVVAHGSAGSVTLGNTTLDQDALLLRAGEIAAWGDHLGGDADLLLYGCDVASTANGQALVQNLAQLTGADVAASDNLTGAAGLGGDWVLEMHTGTIQSASAIDAAGQAAFDAVLATYTVSNTNDSGAGSLRQAIIDANANAGTDTINFTIPGTGIHTIALTSVLPSITGTVILDATTDDSFAANGNKPAIVLDVGGIASSVGLELTGTADGSTIRGLVINNYRTAGIQIDAGSDGHTIAGNYIGTIDATGGSASTSTAGYGISIAGAANNVVGGATAADRNVITGTSAAASPFYDGPGSAVYINGAASSNQISGNYLGTDATGATALTGARQGVYVGGSAASTVVQNNVVAADGTIGLQIESSGTGNLIQGNRVGVTASGNAVLSASNAGIYVEVGNGNTVKNNWLANGLIGVWLGSNVSNTTVQGNRIGTDLTGTLNWGSRQHGVNLQTNNNNNLIGGTGAGDGNIIAFSNQNASTGNAITLYTGTGNAFLGNSIYSTTTGTSGLGIDLDAANGNVTANDAGDVDTGPNNLQNFPVLTSAKTDGSTSVYVAGTLSTNTGTNYYRVEFFASPTGNASGYGEGKTYLGFVNVPTTGGTGTFSTTLSAAVSVGYVISATATRSAAGYATFTDTSEFSQAVSATVLVNTIAVDTAADTLDGDTSSLTALLANKGADGFISLREAITAANNTANGTQPDRINFNITGTGVHTITLSSLLPTITDAVTIDATTDDSFAANGNKPAIVLNGNNKNGTGLRLSSTADGSTIRGLVIQHFNSDAITIDSGSDGNTIAGNFIGSLSATGSSGGTGSNGAAIYVQGANNVIGGTTAADRNVISGNLNGVVIGGASATGNEVVGNFIGTDYAGNTAIANTFDGIRIQAGATSNTIGGSNTNQRNIISGNGGDGVQVDGETSDGNTVKGNWIGVAANGTTALGTGADGIYMSIGTDNNVIGGPGANDGNWIASPGLIGIEIDGISSGNVIQGNRVGTNLAGTANWGSQQNDILIENSGGGGTATNNLVEDNTVAFSGQGNSFTSGIALNSTAGTGNSLLRNVVYSNVGIGIDLGGNSVTANDTGDGDAGANNLQNFPVLTLAKTDASTQLTVSGTLNSSVSSYYRIEFFAAPTGDASGYGEGQTYLGFVNVATNGSGNASFSTTLSGVAVPVGYAVSATATKSDAAYATFTDTSEFARNVVAISSTQATVVVDTAADTNDGDTTSLSTLLANKGADGFVSLREAITAANNTANGTGGADQINFQIAGTGTHTITLGSLLPSITGAVLLDASTDDSFLANSNRPAITLLGSGSATTGLTLAAGSDGSTVRGLNLGGFSNVAIALDSSSNTIAGNYIGALTATGAIGGTANNNGIGITGNNNTIGGTVAADRNIISGNSNRNITLESLSPTGNRIIGNYIGTVNANGSTGTPTSVAGIYVGAGNSTQIGGTGAGEGNLVTGDTGYGVSIISGTGHAILGNTIYGNNNLGINIDANGVTANDAGDSDTGANNVQNFPVLTLARTNGSSQVQVAGTLNSTASSYYRLEFFASATADTSGYGEGQIFLGFVNVATDGSGNTSFSTTLSASVPVGYSVSATATRSNAAFSAFSDTSEFSAVSVAAGPVVQTVPGTQSIVEDVGTAIGGISVSAPFAAAISTTLAVSNGTLLVSLLGGANISTGANGSTTLTLNGTVAQVNAALATLQYTGATNYFGSDTLAVTTSDGAGGSDADNLGVTVTPVNDAPVISSNGGGATATLSLAENTAAVTTVVASDIDGPALTYTISGGADAAGFQINSSTGALSFLSAPDFENPTDTGGNNVYDVTVRVSDGSLADTQAIAVTVTDVNDAPPVITSNGAGATASVSIAENGTAVATVTATDADGPTLSYSIVGGADAARFQINSSTGTLSFVTAPDFENPADVGADNVYDVTVQASDGNLTDTQAIAVTLTNANDNAPVITSNGGGAVASLNQAENGTPVTTVTATDADGSALTYSISGGADAALLQINPSTGVLSFVTAPDFENPTDAGANNVYNVTVRVSDGTFTDTQTLGVTVTDVNDNAPVIASNGAGATASVSITENGTAVATVTATDADGPTLSYSIVGGADVARFQINSSTGALSFVTAPDFENPADVGADNVYDVTVQASDGSLTDTQALAVTVTNLNDNTPVITSQGGGASAALSVVENNTTVTTVAASDADGSALTYSISAGADAALFQINASTGALSFVSAPDFENPTDAGANNVYNVTVRVSDGTLTDTQNLAVTVTDVNDNVPVITSNGGGTTANVSMAENSTAVTTVAAIDTDGPTLTYSVVGGADATRFQINSSTGALSFVTAPDFENPADVGADNVYDVTVQASDGSLTDTQALAVTVTNLNDNTPVITSQGGGASAALSVVENNTTVTTVAASDADGSALTYSISAGADAALFQINASTGALSFVSAPDFENPTDAGANNVYNVTVRVSDGTLTDTQNLAVTVTDVNDNVPVITSNGGGTTANVSMAENSTAVTTVAAIDTDGPTLTYSIVGGADAALFQVNSSTGALSFVGAPDYEIPTDAGTNNVYDVTVQVSDGTFTDSQSIAITVTNLNDNVPVITSHGGGTSAATSVTELTTAVTTVAALDADGSALTYGIVGGADAALFTINASSGALGFVLGPDFENPQDAGANNIYDVQVQASDGTFADTQSIAVTVTDLNDNAPNITSDGGGATAAVSMAENTTTVTTVTAIDSDSPTLTFSITGGADAARFAIDANTGALTLLAAPDYENPQDVGFDHVYEVQVQVSDGGFTDTQAIAVTVTNANDNAPLITSNGGSGTASVSVAEASTAVTTVAATDLDGSTLTYSISGGADAVLFQIDSSTGSLRFVGAPDFEAPTDAGADNVYDLSVQVSDGNASDTQALTVTVTDVNDVAPTITSNGGSATASVFMAENGTAVTAVTATDVDGPSLTYAISGGADAALFQINASTGALSFVSAPDFENPTDAGANNVYNVTVRVSDGTLTDTQNLAVTVTDLNDNAPVITRNGGGTTASVSMAENSTAVTTVTATDVDSPSLTYAISGGADAALFQIDTSTGALSFLSAPDFENPTDAGANNVYDVTVQASDGNLTDTQALTITVTNLNDNAPDITSNGGGASAALNVPENSTTVTTVAATDADGSALAYSISGGADAALFQINASTGVLSFQVAPDFEAPDDANLDNVYDVQVWISDGTLSDTQALSVTVTDVNDNAPAVTSNGGGATASVSIAENGTAVTTVTGTDADGPLLSYSIVGGIDAARFQIDSSTGAMRFALAPDFEAPQDAGGDNVYDVTVQVSDGSTVDSQAIAVTVTNLNDNPPVITSDGGGTTAAVNVVENASFVTLVTATDADGSTLGYSIVGGADAAQFTINTSTGALRFVATRDFENPQDANADNVYDVTVQVSDGSLTDVQALAVTVADANDNAPVIASGGGGPAASVAVAENSTAITTVVATDIDGPAITYSIVGGADAALFQMDGNSGALRFVDAQDFENPLDADLNHVYEVTVQASDGLLADTQTIAVTVTNLNDNAPVITSNGGGATASTSLAENGTAVTAVVATDADGSALAYSIVGGADAALFQIDASTGALHFVSTPDFESPQDTGANNFYDVQVRVSDGSFTDTQAITVAVTDLNDNAPFITSNGGGAAASVSVAENTTAVTTVAASDADGPSRSYSIVGGTDAARFQIDSVTGALSFTSPPDFENPQNAGANNVYEVTVQVSDGSLTDTQMMAVTVIDVNDNAPVITSNGGVATAMVSVAENTNAITTIVAMDLDGPALSYAITGGADAARFSIDTHTGVLGFLNTPNFEAPQDAGADNVYDLVVQASDGTLADTQAIAVTVTDVNEAPVVTSAATVNVAENSTFVLTVTATDVDSPTLGYAISGGVDAACFSVDASSGALCFVGAPNYESPQDATANNVYHLVVSASDGALSASQAITVHVIDINDPPTAALPIADQMATEGTAFQLQFAVNTFVDADPADTLAYSAQLAGGGALPAWLGFDAATRTFSGTPAHADAGNLGIQVMANDGHGGVAIASFTLSVAALNQAPVVLTSGGGASYAWGSAAVAIDSGLLVSDLDNASLSGASVAISAHYAVGQDTLGFIDQNGISGSWNAATGVLTLVGSATVADYQAALRSVSFSNSSALPGMTTRTVLFTVDDGNAASVPAMRDLALAQPNRAPVITSNGGTATATLLVAENTTTITTVTATDADGDVLGYGIVGGADAGLFTIDSSSGALRFNPAPDFEAARDADGNNVYEVVVQVSDGRLSRIQALMVMVVDVNEGGVGLVTDADATPNRVAENAATGTLVGITAQASDPDSTDTTRYSLADDAGGRFAIDATSGVVTVAQGALLDVKTATSHNITVRATSSDGSTRTQSFTLSVVNANDLGISEPTDSNPEPNRVAVRTVDGTAVGITVQAFGADASTPLSYSLVDDAGGRFAIDPLTGVVTVANSALIATGVPGVSYDITVQVQSSGGSVRTAIFSVRLGEADTAALPTVAVPPAQPGSPTAATASPNAETVAAGSSASATKEPTASRATVVQNGLSAPGVDAVATAESGRLLSFEISSQNLLLPTPISGLSERRAIALSQVELLLEEEERLRASSSTSVRHAAEPSIEVDSSKNDTDLPRGEPVIDAVLIGGTALSLGVAIWATRGGALLTSMLATTPAWQNFDPVPVLSRPKPNRGIAGRQSDGAQGGQTTGDSVATADDVAPTQEAEISERKDDMASGTGSGTSA